MPKTKPASPFSAKMVSFFRGLAKNNDREWFTPRKGVFEEHVRAPMIELVAALNGDLRSFAADHVVEPPAKALYRIYRDTRFSNDKTPYKLHVAANFPRHGLPKHAGAGYYFSVSHKEVEVAGGMYMPGPEEIAAVRRAIATDAKTFLGIFEDKALVKGMGRLQGDRLARLPKGFEACAESPAADYVKQKNWYWYVLLPADLALSPRLRKELVERFKRMRAGVDWLNGAVLAARDEQARDAGAAPRRPEPMW